MEEVVSPRSGETGGGDRAKLGGSPHEAKPRSPRVSPPQSALRADSSSIEEERVTARGVRIADSSVTKKIPTRHLR